MTLEEKAFNYFISENTHAHEWDTETVFKHGYRAGQDSQWIRVDERLPEKGEWVLFYFSEANSDGDIEIGIIDNSGDWRTDGGNLMTEEHKQCLTHWMPFPKPPRSKE